MAHESEPAAASDLGSDTACLVERIELLLALRRELRKTVDVVPAGRSR